MSKDKETMLSIEELISKWDAIKLEVEDLMEQNRKLRYIVTTNQPVITKLTTERDHYKALAEAAGEFFSNISSHQSISEEDRKIFEKYQQLKSQQP